MEKVTPHIHIVASEMHKIQEQKGILMLIERTCAYIH